MKKLFYYLSLAVIILVGTANCSSDDSMDVDEYPKQTVFVYMPWSGLYSYLVANLDSIERSIVENRGLGDTRLLVFLSDSREQSSLYEVTYQNGTITHVPINSYTGNSYTSVEGLASLLNEVTAYAPALNYAMIIGGHGCGWTYKDDWESYPTRAVELQQRQTTAEGMPMTRFFGSVADASYAMDVEQLADAIESVGVKMQYILFDDCYMANAETAYALRNATNFLIASTSEVMNVGVPYYRVWRYLASPTPNYANIVSQFYEFYSNYSYPYGALSAIDCRQMEGLAAIMKEINAAYTFDESRRSEVQILDGFNAPLFYDLGSYVKSLDVSNSLQMRFDNQLKLAVRASQCTEYIYTALSVRGRTILVEENCGLTISDIGTHNVANKGKEKTEWWAATH